VRYHFVTEEDAATEPQTSGDPVALEGEQSRFVHVAPRRDLCALCRALAVRVPRAATRFCVAPPIA
jgi:hypothetical protein